jgi:hypothetical protein
VTVAFQRPVDVATCETTPRPLSYWRLGDLAIYPDLEPAATSRSCASGHPRTTRPPEASRPQDAPATCGAASHKLDGRSSTPRRRRRATKNVLGARKVCALARKPCEGRGLTVDVARGSRTGQFRYCAGGCLELVNRAQPASFQRCARRL